MRLDDESADRDLPGRNEVAIVAEQLAELTRTVEEMAKQLRRLRERADLQEERSDSQQKRTETQQELIDLASRELIEVSDRLQLAVKALRESL